MINSIQPGMFFITPLLAKLTCPLLELLNKIFLLILEKEEGGEEDTGREEKYQFVVPLINAFIG